MEGVRGAVILDFGGFGSNAAVEMWRNNNCRFLLPDSFPVGQSCRLPGQRRWELRVGKQGEDFNEEASTLFTTQWDRHQLSTLGAAPPPSLSDWSDLTLIS